MKRKIKDLNFLPENISQSVGSQGNIQGIIACNTNNKDSVNTEKQNIPVNTVAIQVDFQKINACNVYSTNSEVIIASEDEVINKEGTHNSRDQELELKPGAGALNFPMLQNSFCFLTFF